MDDVVWWCTDKQLARDTIDEVRKFLFQKLALEIKNDPRIQRSQNGLPFCGFRVLPGVIRLSRRRKQLYKKARKQWENAFQQDWIDERKLQLGYAAVFSVTAHADAASFRRSVHTQNFCFTEEV